MVGYHGLGGRDFALPHMRAIEFGDLLGFVDAIEAEVQRFEANPETVIQERCAASRLIQERYSPEAEADAAVRVWGQLANSA